MTKFNVLVLGIGNLLWADEGFGVRCVDSLHRLYEFPDHVTLMDGGTQGIYLVQHIRDADVLIVFDAVDYNLEPGTLKVVEGDQVPKFMGVKKISLHQTGFQEVLAMADMMGDAPKNLMLIGVQPVELDDFGGGLRPKVRAQIQPAIDIALEHLKSLGIIAKRRENDLGEEHSIACNIMVASRYEGERPSEELACRKGDGRLVHDNAWAAPTDFEAEMDELLEAIPPTGVSANSGVQ